MATQYLDDKYERDYENHAFAGTDRVGRVQPGECYHLYPQCVFEAFAESQLPELLRTPLNSLCLQIKSLHESIGDFISAALQSPEPLTVRNVVNFLKMIGALDENENLTYLGLSVRDPFLLPQDKKNLEPLNPDFQRRTIVITWLLFVHMKDGKMQKEKDQRTSIDGEISSRSNLFKLSILFLNNSPTY
ncbi:hypothetical protein ACS0TY_029012 [Phlomoides rotata]